MEHYSTIISWRPCYTIIPYNFIFDYDCTIFGLRMNHAYIPWCKELHLILFVLSGIIHSFHSKALTVTSTYVFQKTAIYNDNRQIIFFYFHATVLFEKYLRWNVIHLSQNIQIFKFNFQFCTYHITSAVQNATSVSLRKAQKIFSSYIRVM